MLPLVLGVTGHRDLRPEDLPALRRSLEVLYSGLRAHARTTPIVLLSALAEGADQLAAEVFLVGARVDPADRLVVPLPMAPDDYLSTFTHPEGRSAFERLAARGDLVRVDPAGSSWPETDEQAYERLGDFLCTQSHLLIALWDGGAGKRGGTSEVVRVRMEGVPPDRAGWQDPLAAGETGPLVHVHTPRLTGSGTATAGGAGRSTLVYPGTSGRASDSSAWSAVLNELEGFNREARRVRARDPEVVERSRGWLFPLRSPVSLRPAEARILDVYAVADAMALQNQARSRRTIIGLLLLGLGAVILSQIYADLEPAWGWGFGYGAYLVLGFVVLRTVNRFDWQHRYLSQRALAEGLRVQFFWRVAGVPDSVADAYPRTSQRELAAVRTALRFGDLDLEGGEEAGSGDLDRLSFAARAWVRDQRTYFLGDATEGRPGSAEREARRDHRTRMITRAGVVIGVVAVLALAGAEFMRGDDLGDPRNVFLTASALALAGAAVAAAYGQIMGFAEHARTGRKMGELYRRAESVMESLLAGVPGPAELERGRTVLAEVGREALRENSDWFTLHKERPWEFPLG